MHGNKNRKLAFLIVEDLLGEAPPHLKAPAVQELSELALTDLMTLCTIETLPLDTEQMASLQDKLKRPEALKRLVQRYDVAAVISEARRAGLYEAVEDATSEVLDATCKRPE
jgi:hypothetical protein